jgi:hypothetical protein
MSILFGPGPAPATLHVAPAPGLIIVDPATRRPLPRGGAMVPETDYWRRLLRDGDVVLMGSPDGGCAVEVSSSGPSPADAAAAGTQQAPPRMGATVPGGLAAGTITEGRECPRQADDAGSGGRHSPSLLPADQNGATP